MSSDTARALADHLAVHPPGPRMTFKRVAADARMRWPTLSDEEILWALDRAVEMLRERADDILDMVAAEYTWRTPGRPQA
jgi:hypothetical protein